MRVNLDVLLILDALENMVVLLQQPSRFLKHPQH